MKKVIIALLALVCLVACGKKETAYERFVAMTDATVEQLEGVNEVSVRDSIIEDYIEQSYQLLMSELSDQTTDSVVVNLFYMLTPEQKAELFAALPEKRITNEVLAPVYEQYEIELKTSEGNPYIDIASPQADGKVLTLSELVGKTDYVLVDFWASWCGPCRRSMPGLKDLYESYHPSGKLQILGVSIDKDEADWLEAVEEDELPWLHIRDQRQEPYNPREKYGISAIPTTILINSEGMIVKRNPNEAELELILAGLAE
jgi:thiol-disulfide isomerase/thioredoxin